jgi:hypothetical protein
MHRISGFVLSRGDGSPDSIKGWEFLDQLRDFIRWMYDSHPFSTNGEEAEESERIFQFLTRS